MAKDKVFWIGPGSCMGAKSGEEIKGEIDKKDLKKWKGRGHISSTSLKPDEVAADSAALKKVEELKDKVKEQKKALEKAGLRIAELEKVNAELKEMLK
ncbi:hypothetical protein KA005_16750 [bacterium]|nr:hypothetical protein [bacterium]